MEPARRSPSRPRHPPRPLPAQAHGHPHRASFRDGGTDTTYGGTRTITFSGPANSPFGSAPVYPANVSFTNGVGTATITLYNAASTTLNATDGTKTGSTTFTVGAGSADESHLERELRTPARSAPAAPRAVHGRAASRRTSRRPSASSTPSATPVSNLGASKTVTLTNTNSGSWSPDLADSPGRRRRYESDRQRDLHQLGQQLEQHPHRERQRSLERDDRRQQGDVAAGAQAPCSPCR